MRTSKIISVSLPPEMHNWAEKVARAENRTMSELVREALRVYESVRASKQQTTNVKTNAGKFKSVK